MSKLQSALYNIFLILFIPVMMCIPLLFINNITEIKYITYPVTLTAVFFVALFLIKKVLNTSDKKVFIISVSVLALFLFIMQLNIFRNNPEFILYGDYISMYKGAREICVYGELTGYLEYFLAHPHQLFAAFFYGVLNRIFVIIGLQGPINIAGTVITNCLMITIGGILLSFAIRHVTNNIYGLFTMFVFCLFNSYWGCIVYLYSHTLSVFFVCVMIFCFSYYANCKNDKHKLLWLIASGAAFALCKSSEGITLIAFVAAIIYIVITCPNIKKLFIQLCSVSLSFVITLVAISGIYNILDVIDYTQKDRYEFPLTHWIMMGQGETGEYCEEDYQSTVSLESKQEKLDMHMEEIYDRISSRTFFETIQFYTKKQRTAWIGGTYGASTEFPDKFAYNFAYRLVLIVSIFIGAVYTLIKRLKSKDKTVDFIAFSQIYIIGIFLFFCIWEVSYAYLFSSVPMLIICAVLSLHKIFEKNNTIHNKENLYEQNI